MGSEKQIVFNSNEDRSKVVDQALADQGVLLALVDNLSADQRRIRQFSATAIKEISSKSPEALVAHVDSIADGLHRPEAQTRWECLETLSFLAPFNPPSLDVAVEGAEESLFDEDNGHARLAALRFLCAYGALDCERATEVWPLIEEGIQCYHGDPEFEEMLASVEFFAAGDIGSPVRQLVVKRLQFDADNSKGSIGRRASSIVALCKTGQKHH
ncbi:MAG: hypothetical protein LBC35_04610 [Coriobacteriales bacterium]|jgi:hypothetical protein|nr:hypothetical protein [Coriobacteriales bacterium]